ncbi:hypothetical protein [Nitrosomonas marina]|uniref:hypothetical protein n=1 Tax=Nitrosomonas marina TaxID=917 RepID=UPI000B8061E3|nr:hypothetical protein [Nitrosomonas marina]
MEPVPVSELAADFSPIPQIVAAPSGNVIIDSADCKKRIYFAIVRNRFVVSILLLHSSLLSKKLSWDFFADQHAK